MRIAAWAFVVCTAVSTIAIFIPAIELHVGGKRVGKTESMSLWDLNTSRDKLAALVASFRDSRVRKAGAKIAGKVADKVGGKLRDTARGVRDSLEGVDTVSDSDVKTAATVLSIATWTLLVLNLLALAALFGDTVKNRFRRWRAVLVTITTFFATGITIALGVGFSQAADQGNAELGRSLLTTRAGTYMMPLATIAAFAAAIVLLVQLVRAGKPAAPPMPPPPMPPPPMPAPPAY
ncbi:MAG: hypothetical protein KIT31_28995 [Deltaproteobacteria bacterium]|nr:hypothetical protein [Deltaproteobacteria bacterium]